MKRFLIALVLVLAAVGGLVWLRHHQQVSRAQARDAATSKAIPVLTARVTTADVPI
jgi:hypothetical protein